MPEETHGLGKRFAQVLSVVFQPIFIPFYTILLLFNAETFITYSVTPEVRQYIYGIVLINAVIMPSVVFMFLLRKGIIQSLHMTTASERTIPFLTVIIFQLSTYFLFLKLPLPALLPQLVLAGVLSVVLALLINLLWKVSIHMLGMGGLVGTFIGLSVRYQVDALFLVIALILLAGLVGFARLRLNAHTPAQVYVGFVLGTALLTAAVVVM